MKNSPPHPSGAIRRHLPLKGKADKFVSRKQFLSNFLDAHIDPRSEEAILGSLVGELSAQLTEGFNSREKVKVNSEKKRWLCVAKH